MEKNKKIKIIIVSIVAAIVFIGATTYAMYTWYSDTNVEVAATADELLIYVKDPNGFTGTLNSSSDYSGGLSTTFELWQKPVNTTIYGSINLDIETIDKELIDNGLSYTLISNNNILASGDFISDENDDLKAIYNNFALNKNQTYYTLYIWLDESKVYTSDVSNKTFDAKISVYASQEAKANAPELADGMIPIYYNGTSWSKVPDPYTATYKLGDVNFDGQINLGDSVLLANVVANYEYTNEKLLAADVDCNGIIDENDTQEIVSYVGGSSTTFSCGTPLEEGTYTLKRNERQDMWYDYDEKKWANVVLVKSVSTDNQTLSDGTACTGTDGYCTREDYMNTNREITIPENDILAYYVWIPRYKYQLFNVEALAIDPIEIQIEFEGDNSTTENVSETPQNGEWLTHPGFTLGEEELTGLWVGKFETTGTATIPTVKPGINPLVSQVGLAQLKSSRLIDSTEYFTEKGVSEVDATMMRNTMWGAVAYLKQSKYGLGNNNMGYNNYLNSSKYLTGCGSALTATASSTTCNAYNSELGINASTTGNVYGVYDMAGGIWEAMLSLMYTSTTSNALAYGGSTITALELPIYSPYVDIYTYGTSSTDQNAYNRRILGDATGETRNWFGDTQTFFYGTSNYWIYRGGQASITAAQTGPFCFSPSNGASNAAFGFRSVLAVY